MIRYQVVRRAILFKRKVYEVGELMPASFTEREKARHVYSKRFVAVEIPDEASEVLVPVVVIEDEVKAEPVVVPEMAPIAADTLATPITPPLVRMVLKAPIQK